MFHLGTGNGGAPAPARPAAAPSPTLLACAGETYSACEVAALGSCVMSDMDALCFGPGSRPLGKLLTLGAPAGLLTPAAHFGVAVPLVAPGGNRCGAL